MFYLKALGAAAAIALALPVLASNPANAQGFSVSRGGGGGGGGGVHMGGGGGGGFRAPAMGGGGFRGAAGPRPSMGGGPRSFGGRTWQTGRAGWSGRRGWSGRHRHGFYPGFIGGAIIGSTLAWPYYYDPYYYDDYDYGFDTAVVGAGPSAADVAYCSRRFKSYDPRSGTYLGYDGLRHPCP